MLIKLCWNWMPGVSRYREPDVLMPLRRENCSTRALLAGFVAAALWTCVARAGTSSLGAPALAQEQFICRLSGSSDRRVGIYRPPGSSQRCRVDYTRDGKTRSLWSSRHDYGFCVRKTIEIVGLLEGVKFKCSPQAREPAEPAPIR